MMKKVLAVILVLTVVVPLAVWGMSRADVSAAGITYSVENGVLTISGTGAMNNYEQFGAKKQWNEDEVTEVIIEEGITSIGKYAFYRSKVKFVTIPNTVKSIGEGAFYESKSLVSVSVPGSVKTIGYRAFDDCYQMLELELENGVETIDRDAFNDCSSLRAVTIPPSVKTIGVQAFSGAQNLTVTFSEGLETIGDRAFSGIANTKLTLPDSLTIIGKSAFSNCDNLAEVVTGENLITIGDNAFDPSYVKNLTSVNLSKSQKLTTIGAYAFTGGRMTEIIIPNSVTTIGNYAFDDCIKLVNVTLPDNLTSIGNAAFRNTAIASIEIPNGVKTIGENAFDKCKNLTKVVIPHSVISLGSNAFQFCYALTAVDISGESLTLSSAFNGCPITHVHIPKRVPVAYFAGKYRLPEDESCYFQIGSDGECPAAVCPFRESARVLGDINGDGNFDPLDLIALGKAYMNQEANKYFDIANMDDDSEITPIDIIRLGKLYMDMQK